jgi:hypothetical protein
MRNLGKTDWRRGCASNETRARCFFLFFATKFAAKVIAGNTKGVGSITVLLTSCLTGLALSGLQIKTKIFSCHTAGSKPVKQEVDGTVKLAPLVFPGDCCGWFVEYLEAGLLN